MSRRDELLSAWIERKTESVIYDAANNTSYEDEIRDLVKAVADRLDCAELEADIDSWRREDAENEKSTDKKGDGSATSAPQTVHSCDCATYWPWPGTLISKGGSPA